MAGRSGGVAALVAVMMWGCAEGAQDARTIEDGLTGDAGPVLAKADQPEADDADALLDAGMKADEGPPPEEPAGDPCTQGEMEACLCQDLGTEGIRRCLFDSSSPLDGFFSECEQCAAPEEEPGTAGDAPDAGSGQTTVTMDPPDAGAAAPPPSGAGPGRLSNPAMCMALLQCCRMDGMCGVGVPGLCL